MNIMTLVKPSFMIDEIMRLKLSSALISSPHTTSVAGTAMIRPSRALLMFFPEELFSAGAFSAAAPAPYSAKGIIISEPNISAGKNLLMVRKRSSESASLSYASTSSTNIRSRNCISRFGFIKILTENEMHRAMRSAFLNVNLVRLTGYMRQ